MSFRPTISIYLNDHIIDFGYYKNWDPDELLAECCRLAQKLDGCTTRFAVLRRLGRTAGKEQWERGPEHAFYMYFDQYPEEELVHDSRLAERLRTFESRASYTEDESLLKELERDSEFPICLDLTRRSFYLRQESATDSKRSLFRTPHG